MTNDIHAAARLAQAPGTDYGALKSVVASGASRTRSNADLTAEERTNLEAYLRYKTITPFERVQFHTPTFTLHRRGFIHLPQLTGTGGKEMDHTALEGRFDEIEDVIVKGDRLWSVFTLRAKHIGTIYRQPATDKMIGITEMCILRYEAGKLAEGWFLGDEVSICRQLGITVAVPSISNSSAMPPSAAGSRPATVGGLLDAAASQQKAGTAYDRLRSVVTKLAPGHRASDGLTAEEVVNLDCFLRYKVARLGERPNFQTANYRGNRRGIVHLPELRGTPGNELDHGALEGRFDEIEDIVVKGDRLWCAFTLRAHHVGPLYGMPATGKTVEMLEYCAMRFEGGKIAEGWFFADELGLARQIGIPIEVRTE